MLQMNAAEVPASAVAQRSRKSFEFEALWRALPRQGLVPPRSAFNPARAGRFLRDLILVEAPSPERRALRFRLVGDALNASLQRNVMGADYLDFLAPEEHAEALEAARLICETPCGIWQLNPVHYERGFVQIIEATIFPLGAGADGIPLMLGNLEFLAGPVKPIPSVDLAVVAETSKTFEFIDIGAGVPKLYGGR